MKETSVTLTTYEINIKSVVLSLAIVFVVVVVFCFLLGFFPAARIMFFSLCYFLFESEKASSFNSQNMFCKWNKVGFSVEQAEKIKIKP